VAGACSTKRGSPEREQEGGRGETGGTRAAKLEGEKNPHRGLLKSAPRSRGGKDGRKGPGIGGVENLVDGVLDQALGRGRGKVGSFWDSPSG